VVQRGLQSRTIDMKKKASTIVGNMCNLVADPKDVSPYLGDLLPTLKTVILDPSPDVRLSAAKALGSLVKSMDDADYAALEVHLLATMKSDASMVERAGAALGFGEVLGASPIARLEAVLPEVGARGERGRGGGREGERKGGRGRGRERERRERNREEREERERGGIWRKRPCAPSLPREDKGAVCE
jgi:hypothetical protein